MILEKDYRLLFAKNRKDSNMTVLMYAAKHNCYYVIDVIANFIKYIFDKGLMNASISESDLWSKIDSWVNSRENRNGDTAYTLCCRENKHVNTTMHALTRVPLLNFRICNNDKKLGSHYVEDGYHKTTAREWEYCGVKTRLHR